MATMFSWKNKKGAAKRACWCRSSKQHWINSSRETWPNVCSVEGCWKTPILGAHIMNEKITGEMIVPMCVSCNDLSNSFSLRVFVTPVSVNRSETCEIYNW